MAEMAETDVTDGKGSSGNDRGGGSTDGSASVYTLMK
jgi:hypothetical protein